MNGEFGVAEDVEVGADRRVKRKLFVATVELSKRGRVHSRDGERTRISGGCRRKTDLPRPGRRVWTSPRRSKTKNIRPYLRTRARSSAGDEVVAM